nr:unnamed protein product [Callosobruchus analis]CAI5854222.1 unnamed protein product [Callosobruchus analis]
MDFSEDIPKDSSDEDMVVEYLNQCALSANPEERLVNFHKIQEILLRKSSHLLVKYLQNILNFTTDTSAEIKKALVGFIEELCRVQEVFIPRVMMSLHMLLCDESIQVQKRVIQAAISIYRKTLSWLCKASTCTEDMEQAWKQLNTIKLEIANMIDSDNDGIRYTSINLVSSNFYILEQNEDHCKKETLMLTAKFLAMFIAMFSTFCK